jgi:hypothetical protein
LENPGKPRHRWKDNIKMDIKEEGWRHGLDLSGSGESRWRALENAVINFPVPQNAGNFLTNLEPLSFSGRSLLHGVSHLSG